MTTTAEQRKKLRILIVGAGIAGLAAGRALREDHEVHIFESSSFKTEVGAAIHTGPNATRILTKWGMDLERLESPNCRHIYEYNVSGKLVSHRPLNTIDLFGAPWLLNHRISLHKELLHLATSDDAALPGAPAQLHLGSKVVDVDGEAGVITLADGTTFQGDLIVGGDGIKSLLQHYVLGRPANAKPSGHSAYRLLIPFDSLRELDDQDVERSMSAPSLTMFVAEDRRVVCYTCKYDGRDLLNIVAIVPDEGLFEGSIESWSAKGSLKDLSASFAAFPPTVQKILSKATECALYQLRDQDPLEKWSRNRVLIIGDAAHPMLPHLGQGGSQAIEDAEALAYVLKTSDGLPQLDKMKQALERLQTLRHYRASISQERSRMQALGPRPGSQEEMLGKNTFEFTRFLYDYFGAEDWEQRIKEGRLGKDADMPPAGPPVAAAAAPAVDVKPAPAAVGA
ncbi:related to Salicylate hydroxylase [Sporisorium reilianum SRZ2]|uniref:Related to Salicylate hydroxylase n=1 Tax=Sporisorium reilianum (strain SRZ2) TaxID=999809 RepID=E7A3C7_SPORE|nr:related to Salicylate hydroxylase [Sporisorium reilianum SRZ2]